MQGEFIKHTAPRAVVSLIAGVALGGGMYEVLSHFTLPESQQLANMRSCAKDLGDHPAVSETLTDSCSNALDDVYSYTQGSNKYYLLPSSEMVLSQKDSIISGANQDNTLAKAVGTVIGAGATVGLFSSMTLARRKNRKSENQSTGLVETQGS